MTASFSATNVLLAQGASQQITASGFTNGTVTWNIEPRGTDVSLSYTSTKSPSGSASNTVTIASDATVGGTWTLSATDGINNATTYIMVAPAQATNQDLLLFDIIGGTNTAYLYTRGTIDTDARLYQLGAVPGVLSGYTAETAQLQQLTPPSSGTICVSCYVLNLAALAQNWNHGA